MCTPKNYVWCCVSADILCNTNAIKSKKPRPSHGMHINNKRHKVHGSLYSRRIFAKDSVEQWALLVRSC